MQKVVLLLLIFWLFEIKVYANQDKIQENDSTAIQIFESYENSIKELESKNDLLEKEVKAYQQSNYSINHNLTLYTQVVAIILLFLTFFFSFLTYLFGFKMPSKHIKKLEDQMQKFRIEHAHIKINTNRAQYELPAPKTTWKFVWAVRIAHAFFELSLLDSRKKVITDTKIRLDMAKERINEIESSTEINQLKDFLPELVQRLNEVAESSNAEISQSATDVITLLNNKIK